jgi:VWFA-related protein
VGLALRWFVFTLVLGLAAIPTWAAKKVSVAQLEQMLTSDRAAHKSDIDIAKHIAAIELSERLTQEALKRLQQPFAGDSRTATALFLLADRSAFLDLPASELPATPPPDAEVQQHLLELAHKFAVETLPQLPNLLATRTTYSFDDSPQEVVRGAYPQRAGMHLIGSGKSEVSVSRERSGQASGASGSIASSGLTTWGEFGSALLIILGDSVRGKMNWSHWESTPTETLAVFHYEVPKSASHFEVDTSVEEFHAGESVRMAGQRAKDMGTITSSSRMMRSKPGYQGSLWIDPATGTIRRLTLVADLKGNPRFDRGGILVEYGPVQIANKTLICPLRSLALSEAPPSVNSTISGSPTEWVNENTFTDYHLFSSTSRILTEVAGAEVPSPANAGTQERAASAAGTTPEQGAAAVDHLEAEKSSSVSEPKSDGPPPVPPPPLAPQQAQPPASNSVSNAEATVTENAVAAAPQAAAQPAPEMPPSQSVTQPSAASTPTPSPAGIDETPRLRVEAQELLIPAVVRDKQGHAVGNLTKQDFRVFDQGKARDIRNFTVFTSGPTSAPTPGSDHGDAPAATPPDVQQSGAQSPFARRFMILLFDDRHVDPAGLALAQKAALHMLDEPLASSDYAAVVSLSGANSGITQDRAALKAAVSKLSIHAASQHVKEDCPDIDYYAADKIIRQHDATEFLVAVLKTKKCSHLLMFQNSETSSSISGVVNDSADPFQRMAMSAATRALAQGEQDSHQTLAQMETVVHAMRKLDGQRIIILLSPGFLSLAPEDMAFKSQILDQAAAANVVINALDVRGLYVGNADASEGQSATISQTMGATSSDHLASMQASENAMSELAFGTGGNFFHNNNDLVAGLKRLAAAPEYVYLLSIPLKDLKTNGTFHKLKVEVNRKDLDVQARHGYFAPKR